MGVERAWAFRRDVSGASAIEFSLLLPVLCLLYIGGNELTQALDANRKLTDLTRATADVVAKTSEVTTSDLSQFVSFAKPLMAPHSAKAVSVTIVAVWTDENSVSTVDWAYAGNGDGSSVGAAPAKGAPYALPESLVAPRRQTIVASASYPFAPKFGSSIVGAVKLNDVAYLAPRSGKCVKRTGSGIPSCNR